jgi:hypothetical protein
MLEDRPALDLLPLVDGYLNQVAPQGINAVLSLVPDHACRMAFIRSHLHSLWARGCAS